MADRSDALTGSDVPSTSWASGSPRLGPSEMDPLVLHGSPTAPLLGTFLAELDPRLAGARVAARGRSDLLELLAIRPETSAGLHLDPTAQVVVTNGAMHGLDVVFRALIAPGSSVGILCPTFFADRLLRGWTHVVEFHTRPDDGWRLHADVLDRIRTARLDAFFLVNPNNPTGVVYTAAEIDALLEAVGDALVVVDEAYEAFTYGGRRHVVAATLDSARERVVTVRSFTKSFGLGAARIGWVFGPADLMGLVSRHLAWVTLASNALSQSVALAALGAGEEWRGPLIAELHRNHRRITDAVDDGLLPSDTLIPEGATFAALDVSAWGGGSEDSARRVWTSTGIACVPWTEFPGERSVSERYLRLPLGAQPDVFDEALRRLAVVFA